jgi:hypothetical protein
MKKALFCRGNIIYGPQQMREIAEKFLESPVKNAVITVLLISTILSEKPQKMLLSLLASM